MSSTQPRRRPGGRSARVRSAVIEATLAELRERGPIRLSIAAVARRAEVHETSIYRRWKTRERLIAAALLDHSERRLPIPDTGSLRGDLAVFGERLAAHLSGPLGGAVLRAVAATGGDPATEEARERFAEARQEQAGAMVRRAIGRGEAAADTDPELIIEALVSPLHARVLLSPGPIPADLPRRLADLIVDGLGD